jgi:hypothetical protein
MTGPIQPLLAGGAATHVSAPVQSGPPAEVDELLLVDEVELVVLLLLDEVDVLLVLLDAVDVLLLLLDDSSPPWPPMPPVPPAPP